MQLHLTMLPKCSWVLLVVNVLMHIGLPTASTELVEQAIASEALEYHTYIILDKDADNVRNAVNCTAPRNVSFPVTESNMLPKWTAPSGVHLMMATTVDENPDGSSEAGKYQIADHIQAKRPWVELTADGTLVFHNPDDSISGAYICQSKADDQVIYQTTVWVHVFKQNVFDVVERVKVAIITTVIFLGFVLACWGLNYWCQRNRVRYILAKRNEDPINIPTIQIVGASDEKI